MKKGEVKSPIEQKLGFGWTLVTADAREGELEEESPIERKLGFGWSSDSFVWI